MYNHTHKRFDFIADIDAGDPTLDYLVYQNIWSAETWKHSHSTAEWFFVKDGLLKLEVGSRTYELKRGDLLIVNPYLLHMEYAHKQHDCHYYVIGVSNLAIKDPQQSTVCIEQNPDFMWLFEKLYREASDTESTIRQKAITAIFEMLIIEVMHFVSMGVVQSNRKTVNELINQTEEYLSENYKNDISLQELSERFFCTPKTLNRNFKKLVGTTITQYIINKRIDDARLLLTITATPVTHIARLTGFSSPAYFARIFRRETGMTPREYRKAKADKDVIKKHL